MQIPSLVVIAVLSISSVFARDFRPPSHLENIPASNSSVQQCYVFQTTPGVAYTVEVSNNLSDWTPQDELYGLGGEYAVAMREFTPPPPPPPGTPPSVPPPLATNVSLRLQPATGAAGGSVVAWRSLDHDVPIIVRIAAEIDPGWYQIPIFWDRFDDYYFYFWHPGVAVAPPAGNSALGPKDSAMLAVLEASVPAINQQIAASIVRSRNAPPPAPPDPDSKRFWRVKVDWSLDTDQDGSPDWAEFEIAALGTGMLVPGVVGDAFNEDTNNDGVPDGLQLDSDGDGTPDGIDINPSDNTATFPIGPAPRYALFPITNAQPTSEWPTPFQISDKGTVLYGNGTWTGGTWTPLNLGTGAAQYARSVAINDSDQILGSDSEPGSNYACYWSDPLAPPNPVEVGDIRAALWPDGTYRDCFDESLLPGPLLANDGGFYCPAARWGGTPGNRTAEFLHYSRWKIPSNGQPTSHSESEPGLRCSNGPGLQWGYSNETQSAPSTIQAATTLPAPPFTPTNVVVQPGGSVLAMPSLESDEKSQVFIEGAWKPSATYGDAIDIAANGTAIGRTGSILRAPILINGDWKSIFEYAPKVPDMWRDSSVKLLDTTPGGWVLAERGVWPLLGISYPEYAVLLPIRADGVDPALSVPPLVPAADPPEYINGGVDHTSMTAYGGTGKVPEIWIMAPNGGASNSVRFQSPLNSNCKLTLESDADVGFTPGELDSKDMIVQVNGKKTATADFSAKLKLGGTLDSLSVPLKIKAMKKRTVKVAVHKVFGMDASGNQTVPIHFPAMNDLDTYLNEVFGRQANTFFQCTQHDEKGPAGTGIDFDLGISDGKIRYAIDDLEVQELTVNPKSTGGSNATANIDIWVFGGGVVITDYTALYDGYQIGAEFEGKILIDGDQLGAQGTASELSAKLLNTIAHEIGHVMVGWGHATDGKCRSVLIWEQTASGKYKRDSRNNTRLMATGLPLNLSNSSKQLIKKEWDLMEAWLKNEEQRLGRSL